MPELPDVMIYVEAIREFVVGQQLKRARCLTPFILRTVSPPISSLERKKLQTVDRMGKRIVLGFEDEFFLVIHLMISGRLFWQKPSSQTSKPGGKLGLAAFEFEDGMLLFTEASTQKRATLHVVHRKENLEQFQALGVEPLSCSMEEFKGALLKENRSMKRALTNPRAFSGIGNSYSDEILHAARISPLRLTHALREEEIERLYQAARITLERWTDRLREEFKGKFPGKGQITAFRHDFAAHGKFGKPCPDCGLPIQRIQYAENETNYCAKCQNEGRILADRSLSRLLKDDWPKTIWEMAGE